MLTGTAKKATNVVSLYFKETTVVAFSSSPWEEPHPCLAPVIEATNFVASMTGARQNEALPTGWMKKRQFRSTLSEGVELMTGFD